MTEFVNLKVGMPTYLWKFLHQKVHFTKNPFQKIINERGSITPDMALRLSRAFETTPVFWLNLQKNYDLWQAETHSKEWKKVTPIPQQIFHAKGLQNSEQVVYLLGELQLFID